MTLVVRIVESPAGARLGAWWAGLTSRERWLVGTMAVLLATVVLVQPAAAQFVCDSTTPGGADGAAATGAAAVACGSNADASGDGSIAFGFQAGASQSDAVAVGANANAIPRNTCVKSVNRFVSE